jgi:hypothetical protein
VLFACVIAACSPASLDSPLGASNAQKRDPTPSASARGSPQASAGGVPDVESTSNDADAPFESTDAGQRSPTADTALDANVVDALQSPGKVTTSPEGRRGISFAVTNGALQLADFAPGDPIIYDNDWWNDIVDSAYLLALNSLGKLSLKGLVVSRDFFGRPNYVQTLAGGVEDAQRLIANARAAGLRNVPDVTVGSGTPLSAPASGKIDDTAFTPTAGSNLILAAARRAAPQSPLIVYVGGSATTTATAYLQDPSIADRMIVAMCDPYVYNAADDWSIYVLAMRTRFVAYHFEYNTNALTQAMFDTLPQNALTAHMKSATENKLILDNQMGDGVLVVFTFNPGTVNGAQKYDIDRAWSFHKTGADPYGFLDVPRANIDYAAQGRAMIATLKDPAVYGGTH